jgi:hypothetical protein
MEVGGQLHAPADSYQKLGDNTWRMRWSIVVLQIPRSTFLKLGTNAINWRKLSLKRLRGLSQNQSNVPYSLKEGILPTRNWITCKTRDATYGIHLASSVDVTTFHDLIFKHICIRNNNKSQHVLHYLLSFLSSALGSSVWSQHYTL